MTTTNDIRQIRICSHSIEEIWPLFQRANQEAIAHGKIFRGRIIPNSPDKPFVRARKYSVTRPKYTALYADEIEALFNDSIGDTELGALLPEQVQDTVALEASLGAYVRSILLDLPGGANGHKEGLFAYGLDSIQTIELASGLRALVHPHLNPTDLSTVGAKVIYAYSTVDSSTEYVSGLLGMATSTEGNMAARRVIRMTAMLGKYTKDLPGAGNGAMRVTSGTNGTAHTTGVTHANDNVHTNGITDADGTRHELRVLLTGSTGSLGIQLLQAHVNDPVVSRVICLNRAEDALQRARKGLAQRTVSIDLSKAFYKTQFADIEFVLSTDVYNTLRDEVDIIIHDAWNVNFNH